MTDEQKEFFLMLHGWTITSCAKKYNIYFPPDQLIGTSNLAEAVDLTNEWLAGKAELLTLNCTYKSL
jgi:hypothetical protein